MKRGNQGDGGGRPMRVLTDEEIIKVEALASTLTIPQLADYLGIEKSSFYSILERQPDVKRRYKKGKSFVISNVADNLVSKAQDGDTLAQMFFLKTQAGWKESCVRIKTKQYKDRSDDLILKDIISSLLDNKDSDSDIHLDNQTLNTINNLIKTKNELSELKELKERLDALEGK